MLRFLALLLAAVIFPWSPPPAGARDNLRSAVKDTAVADLPKEAGKTLKLIKKGGPFPYPRDGAVFGNFERRLPSKERGYYREYTVPTPRSRDRGARRIVAGRNGEYYYTGDHYRTFHRIRE
jgi:ribonuclease T1